MAITFSRKTFWKFIGLLVLSLCPIIVMSFLSGCTSSAANTHSQGATAMPVTMMPVAERIYPDEAEFMAEVDSKHATDIHPQVSSRIVSVLATDGEQVHTGQPLYQLDISQQAATVRSWEATRRASLEEPWSLQKNIEAQKADLAFSQKQLNRYRELVKNHTVSEMDTEQYETKVKSLKANIASEEAHRKQALANIQRDTAGFQSAKADLNYYTVRAPFSGTVGTLIVKVGDVVEPNTILTTLTDNHNLEINIALSADYRPRVHLGTSMTLLSSYDQILAKSKISYIAPKVDPMTQTILVKAKVVNGKSNVSVDQHLKARLIWGEKRAVLVPIPAVFRVDGQPFIYRADTSRDGKGMIAHMQAVTLGPIINQDVVVVSGLKSGQILITGGIQKLQEGVPVMEIPKE